MVYIGEKLKINMIYKVYECNGRVCYSLPNYDIHLEELFCFVIHIEIAQCEYDWTLL